MKSNDRLRPTLRRSDKIILVGILAAVVIGAVLTVLLYGGTP